MAFCRLSKSSQKADSSSSEKPPSDICQKKQDIHRALIEKGFTISYSSVCKYILQRKAEKSRKPKDVFVKQYYEPGEECEFDWGEVKLRIGGKPVTFTMAVFALCHSEGRWAYLFRHQDNLAFMESHRNFFHDVHTRWEEVLKDKVLCSALVDRLCHKSYLVNMTGTSYRIKETKKFISNK